MLLSLGARSLFSEVVRYHSQSVRPDRHPVVDRYGVPGTHAKRLEEAMRFNAPARFEEERDLLHHLVALAPPSLLAAQGAVLCSAVYGEPHLDGLLQALDQSLSWQAINGTSAGCTVPLDVAGLVVLSSCGWVWCISRRIAPQRSRAACPAELPS